MTYNVLSNGLINNNTRRIFGSANAYAHFKNVEILIIRCTKSLILSIYDLNSGNLTISKFPSIQSWQVANKIDAELIDLPDSILTEYLMVIHHVVEIIVILML